MSRDKIHGKSFDSTEDISCTPRYVNVFKDITSFPYYEKKYCENTAKLQDYLFKKLKDLKPNDKKKLLTDNESTDSYLDETSDSRERIFHMKKKLPLNKRKQMIPVNGEKAHERKHDLRNREMKVCEQLNESSRLAKKMHRNDYDRSRGKRYSKGFFEKFPYASGVTSLEAMNSCSSLDVPVYRIKNEQTKPSLNKYKNNTNKIRGCRKSNKLSSTSLVVNYSPESDFDSYQDRGKISTLNGSNQRNPNICQCSSESDYSNEDNISDKNCEPPRNSKTYNCCCADEEKVKAGCSYYCRCPGYRDDDHETYTNFEPKYFATPFKDNEKSQFIAKNDNSKLKKNRNYGKLKKKIKQPTSDINLSDLTPDVPMPTHWSHCGQHMTNVANEYRHLLNNFKTIQSMATNPNPRKTRKKFTRTYPSGKEFTFEVKPAKDVKKGENFSYCQCNNSLQLLKGLKSVKKSIILDGYNSLVKRHAFKKNDKRFAPRNKCKTRAKSEISVCICERNIIDKTDLNKKKNVRNEDKNSEIHQCNLKMEKINSVCENLNENLNFEGEKLNKCQELDRKNQEMDKFNFPRIVKPKGVFCRGNLRKIFICPPHGEEGTPLTLNKKCSNIDCRIKGDNRKGYKYKVIYKQEFLSPVWYPEEKKSPFRKKENTAEYG